MREVINHSDLFETLDKLKERGSIRYFGVSVPNSSSSEDAAAFLQVPGVSVVQLQRNPIRTVDVRTVLPIAAERGVGVILREPFKKGDIFENYRLLNVVAKNPYYSPPQMTIRGAMQSDGVSSVLVGMRTRTHLKENIGALSGPPLMPGEVEELYALAEVS
jgi:aryl-alcohol dehydrogenase-like predicted oxidoreductase